MKSKVPGPSAKPAPAKAKSAAALRDLPPRKDPKGGLRKQEQNDK